LAFRNNDWPRTKTCPSTSLQMTYSLSKGGLGFYSTYKPIMMTKTHIFPPS